MNESLWEISSRRVDSIKTSSRIIFNKTFPWQKVQLYRIASGRVKFYIYMLLSHFTLCYTRERDCSSCGGGSASVNCSCALSMYCRQKDTKRGGTERTKRAPRDFGKIEKNRICVSRSVVRMRFWTRAPRATGQTGFRRGIALPSAATTTTNIVATREKLRAPCPKYLRLL